MRHPNLAATWEVLDDIHLPNVLVTDLALNSQAGVLRASTFGRDHGSRRHGRGNGGVANVLHVPRGRMEPLLGRLDT